MEFDSVKKQFPGRTAVECLSFQIPQGSLYGFIGPNGSGKTTTLRMMLRILYPDAGRVSIFGKHAAGIVDDDTGYLPEERGLYRRMRVVDVLRFHAQLKNVKRPEPRIAHWLERLGVAGHARARISQLSKGLAQRVQFAAAVIHDPRLLVLDEPFSGLDPVGTEALRQIILDLRRGGTTVVLSTHDMAVAERMCDRVLMLHQGNKVLDGEVDALKRERGHDCVHVRFERDVGILEDPAVARVRNYGREQVLDLWPGSDAQALLLRLMSKAHVVSFSIATPSLHEIFVDIAGAPPSRTANTEQPVGKGEDEDEARV
ncbi:MAG TPA: ATP-binding cassette domain-containing protein [Polyangiaceae bacterium]|nr:ATP-binding cassette domain-containing protein [Polyangiaceae bacterium]